MMVKDGGQIEEQMVKLGDELAETAEKIRKTCETLGYTCGETY